jgi:hypothetical protein
MIESYLLASCLNFLILHFPPENNGDKAHLSGPLQMLTKLMLLKHNAWLQRGNIDIPFLCLLSSSFLLSNEALFAVSALQCNLRICLESLSKQSGYREKEHLPIGYFL